MLLTVSFISLLIDVLSRLIDMLHLINFQLTRRQKLLTGFRSSRAIGVRERRVAVCPGKRIEGWDLKENVHRIFILPSGSGESLGFPCSFVLAKNWIKMKY